MIEINHPNCPIPLHVNPTTGERVASRRKAPTPDASPLPFSTPSYSAAGLPARLQIAAGGEWARVTMPKPGAPERREWRRGSVSTFSPRSRSRMLQSLAKTDQVAFAHGGLFVTLTYPREWPPSTRACKAHLEAFRKRVERRWPDAWFYWKLEFQQRGAEHFHLLLFGVGTVNPEWFHSAWHDIVRLGNHWHEEYGADVRRMYSWKQAGAYCAKYAAKVETNATTPTPGRFWGIGTRRNRIETVLEAQISEPEFYLIRRAFKRYIRAPKGYHAPGGSRSGVWCRISNGAAKRLLEYASSSQRANQPGGDNPHPVGTSYGGMPPGDSVLSSTHGSAGARQSTIESTLDNARLPLLSQADRDRRRSQRLWA